MSKNENYKQHKRGRPTRLGQLNISKELRPYFERGMSTSFTATKTGMDPKTVAKYFDEWVEQLIESETNDFLETQKKEKERMIISYDWDISETYEFRDKLDVQTKKYEDDNKPIPKHLLAIRLDVMRYISSLKERKGAISMQPTIDEALHRKIEDMIAKHDKSRTGG